MKKALKIILVSLVCICLLLLAAGYAILTQVDFNSYKKAIVQAVYEATGRELTIGDIQIQPSFNPVVEVRNLTLSNAAWAKNPVMVSIKSVDLGFGILPLLRKKYEINTFAVSDAVVNLEESAAGKANWEFVVPENKNNEEERTVKTSGFELIGSAYAATENKAKAEDDSNVANILSSLVIRQVALDNVKVNFTDRKAQKQSYDIRNFNLDENSEGNIDFDFDVNNGIYKGKGVLGALELVDSESGYPLISELSIDGIKIAMKMKLFDLLGNLSFDGEVQAMNFIGTNSGYNESAEVTLEGNLNKINMAIKSFRIAGNEITGTATADLATKVPTVRGKLNSPKIDLASFEKKQKTVWNFSLINEAQATTLAPETAIPYQALYSVNADVDFNVARIVNGAADVAKDLMFNAKVDNGVAAVKMLKGSVADGSVKVDAVLSAPGQSLTFKADAAALNLQKLMTALNATSPSFNFISGSNTDIDINLSGKGITYASVIDSLDGRVVVIVDKSQVHLGNIGVMKGNIVSQLFNTLNLTKGNDDLNLSCAVVRADVKNGKADFPNGVVVNADKFTIVASGDINLKKDSISMSIKPFAGKLTDTNIAKALSSLVKLTGTVQNPKIGVDSANAIKTIVGVTTAGPVYLGTQMLLENDGSPCYTALQGTGFENKFPKPDNVVTQTTGDVGKILDDSVGIVKDTTKGILNILSGGARQSETAQ